MLVSGCQSQKSWYPWHRIRAQHWASLVAQLVKNPPAMHGKRSLADCSPRDHKESDLSERLSTHTYMGSALEFFKTSPGDSNVQTILRTLTIQGVELQGTFYIIHFYSVWTFCQILHRCCCLVTLLQPHGLYVACQAPLFMGFPRQEYWGGCHFLLQGIFPTQGSNPCLLL